MSDATKLTVLSEVDRGRVYGLVAPHYGLGRAREMDITLPDPSVSAMHCELIQVSPGRYQVLDDGYSTNGTRVNGMVITRQDLHNGDILQVGSVECMYESPEPAVLQPISHTDTHIDLNKEAIQENTVSELTPLGLRREDSHKVRLVFGLVLTALGLCLAVLVGVLIWHVFVQTA